MAVYPQLSLSISVTDRAVECWWAKQSLWTTKQCMSHSRSCTTHRPSRENTLDCCGTEFTMLWTSSVVMLFHMLFPWAPFSSVLLRLNLSITQIACSHLDKLEMICTSLTTTTTCTAVTCVFSRRPTNRINSHRWSFSVSSWESASFSSNTSGSGLLSTASLCCWNEPSCDKCYWSGRVPRIWVCLCAHVMLTLLCFL